MIHVQFVPKTILLQTGHRIECGLDDNKIIVTIVYRYIVRCKYAVVGDVVNAGRKVTTQTARGSMSIIIVIKIF